MIDMQKTRLRRQRRQQRFERPLRDLSGYLLYAAAPLLTWLLDRKKAPDDPLRGSVEERREAARKRPFYAAEAMLPYLERMMLWFFLSCLFLGLFVLGTFLVPDESPPLALHLALSYPATFGLWMSLPMLLLCGAKVTLAWIFAVQPFGRETEQPFVDHSDVFDLIQDSPELTHELDPPAPVLGRMLRPILTPSNADTLLGVLAGAFMVLGAALEDPWLDFTLASL
jgi:hypothetical protein